MRRWGAVGLSRRILPPAAMVVFLSLGVLAGMLGLRWTGILQPLELRAYDALLSVLRRGATADPRITLVAVREADIQRHGTPLRDELLAETLERLLAAGPRAVGLDLFRDHPEPPGHERLTRLLREDGRIIAVMMYPGEDDSGVAPPPAVENEDPERIGFADMVIDPDGAVRRGLLFLGGGEEARWSLALRLALAYLAPEGILLEGDERNPSVPRLGAATYPPLHGHAGGYAGVDDEGYQFLLTYPAGLAGFTTVSLGQVLDGDLAPEAIRDRIVILGTVAESVKDSFLTPLTVAEPMPGAALHAQIASQLIRQALDEARPLRPAPWPVDAAWIAFW
jgi:adenylate cyclase